MMEYQSVMGYLKVRGEFYTQAPPFKRSILDLLMVDRKRQSTRPSNSPGMRG